MVAAGHMHAGGLFKYLNDFLAPSLIASNIFMSVEKEKLRKAPLLDSARDYMKLTAMNFILAQRIYNSSLDIISAHAIRQSVDAFYAWLNTFLQQEGEDIETISIRHRELLERVTRGFPEAIEDIKGEYGFHFDNGGYEKAAETECFLLYKVLPTDKRVTVREDGKPIIMIPPNVLGPNILSFLPGERKSYVHCFANQGVPTYVRILKDIHETPAVQTMDGEDDVSQTRRLCEEVKARHGRPATLNGYCQGGFIAAVNILSGRLDGLVDALICCVAPMDGSRSESLAEFIFSLPPRFLDLCYTKKTLSNGNEVVDGEVMSWVYKLKSIENQNPFFAFHRDIMMHGIIDGENAPINKTAAAINYWLLKERTDLSVGVTRMSFDSYTTPVTRDGFLPVKLFGKKLNFNYLKEKGIHFLICYTDKDDLVSKEAALAPLDYVDAEVSVFPKGHVAIVTSWAIPTSKCAIHTRFGDQGQYRGPVRYQLDLEDGF
ncbi:MAG: metal transporter [Desulfobacterales bacterium]|nr:metal transporter [Desulfobacterales bacterium]